MLGLTGFLGLTRISFFCSHRFHRFHYCFVGGKSHRWFCVWAGSHGFHFAFGLTQISQIPRYCFVGGKSHRWFCVWAGSHGFHFAFGHTDLTDPTVLLCGWEISQMFLRVGWLTRISLCFWAHTDLTDPTVLLCGWEISQMLLCVGWLARISLCFWAHTDFTVPRYCFVGGKSHRCFCAWVA